MAEISPDKLLWMHRQMTTIRMFERRVAREFRRGDMPGFVHSYAGEEAIAVGVCAHLTDDDYIASTHRGHGHCIAKGSSLRGMWAELYGRETGLCKGRGGSMHIADFDRGMLGANAIVGGAVALATGGALAAQVRGGGNVSVSFFGDGATNQGVLYESINLAAIWKLPVIYVCENNGWAESTPIEYSTAGAGAAARAEAFGIPATRIDASDVSTVYEAAGTAIERARAGGGPSLIEAVVPRIDGHYTGDPEGYRPPDDRDEAADRDPLPKLRASLAAAGLLSPEDVGVLEEEIKAEMDDGVEYAKSSPLPKAEDVEVGVYAEVIS